VNRGRRRRGGGCTDGEDLNLIQVEPLIGGIPKDLHVIEEDPNVRWLAGAEDRVAVISVLVPPDDVPSGDPNPHHRTFPQPAGEGPGDKEVKERGGRAALSDTTGEGGRGRGVSIDRC
jgi:hypothetical protein